MEEVRVCSRCGETKPISDYRANQRGIRLMYCRSCYNKQCADYNQRNKEAVKARATLWQKENRERANETVARWREKQSPGALSAAARDRRLAKLEQARSREREHYRLNGDAIRERRKKARDADPEKHRALGRAANMAKYHRDIEATRAERRERYAANRAYYKALVHAYRAKKAGFGGRYAEHAIASILLLQRGKCAYCRADIRKRFDVDHILAIANGGPNVARNLQLTCARCNRSKGKKDPLVFARSLGRLL